MTNVIPRFEIVRTKSRPCFLLTRIFFLGPPDFVLIYLSNIKVVKLALVSFFIALRKRSLRRRTVEKWNAIDDANKLRFWRRVELHSQEMDSTTRENMLLITVIPTMDGWTGRMVDAIKAAVCRGENGCFCFIIIVRISGHHCKSVVLLSATWLRRSLWWFLVLLNNCEFSICFRFHSVQYYTRW